MCIRFTRAGRGDRCLLSNTAYTLWTQGDLSNYSPVSLGVVVLFINYYSALLLISIGKYMYNSVMKYNISLYTYFEKTYTLPNKKIALYEYKFFFNFWNNILHCF